MNKNIISLGEVKIVVHEQCPRTQEAPSLFLHARQVETKKGDFFFF